jgi:hypothetical protein
VLSGHATAIERYAINLSVGHEADTALVAHLSAATCTLSARLTFLSKRVPTHAQAELWDGAMREIFFGGVILEVPAREAAC